jgi:nicotinamidase-related amidase
LPDFKFDYTLDPEGPKGISKNSWLDKNKLGLVLVDFQNYWLDRDYGSESEIVWREKSTGGYVFDRFNKVVLPNVRKLIQKFRETGLKIIYLRNASKSKELQDINGVLKKVYAYELKDKNGKPYHMLEDEYASQIIKELEPGEEDIIITKISMGAFNSSDIDSVLKKNGISRLVFSGGYTDACVDSTVRGAIDKGYLSIVAEDACLSNVETDHLAALRILDKYFTWVTKTEDILKNI